MNMENASKETMLPSIERSPTLARHYKRNAQQCNRLAKSINKYTVRAKCSIHKSTNTSSVASPEKGSFSPVKPRHPSTIMPIERSSPEIIRKSPHSKASSSFMLYKRKSLNSVVSRNLFINTNCNNTLVTRKNRSSDLCSYANQAYKLQSCYNAFKKLNEERDESDKELLDDFCSQYFPAYSATKTRMLSDLFFCEEFPEGKEIETITKDDRKLIIVCNGKIGVYTEGGRRLDVLEPGKIYSDSFLYNKPAAKFFALKETHCACLLWSDFLGFLKEVEKLEQQKKVGFFKVLHYLQYWPLSKLVSMAYHTESLRFRKGDTVYNINSPDRKVYFVAKGEFINAVPFNLQEYNKYPIGSMEWEVLVTTRKMLKVTENYKLGSVFGQLEVASNAPRRSQVKAATNGKVYYIDWSTYFEYFTEEERKNLENRLEPIKEDPSFHARFTQSETKTKKRSQALLDAVNVNPPYRGYNRLHERASAFINRKQKKLADWLKEIQKATKKVPAEHSNRLKLIRVFRERQKVTPNNASEDES